MASTVQKLRLDAEPKGMFGVARHYLRARLNPMPRNIVIRPSDLPMSNAHNDVQKAVDPISRSKIKTGPITAFEQTEIDDLSRMRGALYCED